MNLKYTNNQDNTINISLSKVNTESVDKIYQFQITVMIQNIYLVIWKTLGHVYKFAPSETTINCAFSYVWGIFK